MRKEKVILGIDPGTNVMGFGVLLVNNRELTSAGLGIVKMTEGDYGLKLKTIFEQTLKLIDTHLPDELAIEAPFYGKNVQSMLKLGRAQGVAMAAALYREVPITEYSPRKIKQSITGNGGASKEQVAAMIKQLVKLDRLPKYLDATDGLAVAICHHFQSNKPNGGKSTGSWEQYIKQNPNKIR
ncbi:MAG: crossover junction endodeoxyribonuclease RuvC [Salibacteraceae bacterium]